VQKYKIISGEFSLVLEAKNSHTAALRAINLHIESNHHTNLGQLTMTQNEEEGEAFFSTRSLIDASTFYVSALSSCKR
jgi:hypothetical protein